VTYLGSAHGVLAALRYMRPRNRGTILQVGSALAYRGIPLQAGYCAAKFAIRGFLGSLRSELIYEGSSIRVCMVELSAHTAPTLHGHLGCVCPRVRNVEYFHDHARIEPILFDGALLPDDGALAPDAGRPGLGLILKAADAQRFAA
jgi:NAD(P)-dependent dehydrogenase (short-subunit alcohol dehydrogenase family)